MPWLVKKKKQEEAPASEGWLVSYADMMTLLFATFVILWAFKVDGDPKPTKAMSQVAIGLKNAIRGEITDIPLPIKKENKQTDFGFFERQIKDNVIPRRIKVHQPTRRTSRIILDTMKKVKKDIDVQLKDNRAYQNQRKHSRHEIVSLIQDSDGFKVRILASSLYKPGQYKLSKANLAKINAVGKSLKKLNRHIVIEGHTDSTKAKGKISNWELSALRAGYIAKYFVNELNFYPKKVSVAGYADTQPVADNATKDGRNLNRRIDIKVRMKRI